MITIAKILVLIIAFEHLFILWVEMFAWTTMGKKMFQSIEGELFSKTKVMAANQGLYNGFLAAGLIWSVFIANGMWAYNIAAFFLGCIVVAGSYGGITVSKSVFFKQALPALIALIMICILR